MKGNAQSVGSKPGKEESFMDRFPQLRLVVPVGSSEDRQEAKQQVPSLLRHCFPVPFDLSTLFQRGVKDHPYCKNSMVSIQSQQICQLKQFLHRFSDHLFIIGESEWFKSLARIKERITIFKEF